MDSKTNNMSLSEERKKSIEEKDIWHVLPKNDVKPHTESTECRCGPKVIELENESQVIIHYAFDNRQLIEQVNEKKRQQ